MTARKKAASATEPDLSFTPRAFTFLRGLTRNNAKPWFEDHRIAYENEIKAPLLSLIEEMDARLAEIAPEMIGDRRRSMFRIHRDVRFSNDKRPYKTNAACWFFHRDALRARAAETAGSTAHGGAGFYFQLAPRDCWIGGGMWMPPRAALNKIREALVDDVDTFVEIVDAPAFKRRFGELSTDAKLTRIPRGYDAGGAADELLKLQSFTAGRQIDDAEALGSALVDRLVEDYRALVPLVRWINGALGLKPAARR